MIGNIAVYFNKEKKAAEEIAGIIEKKAADNSVSLTFNSITSKTELAVSVGGDGTVLRTARNVADLNIPVASINVGTLGFIGSVAKNIDNYIDFLLKGDYEIEERVMLQASISQRKLTALNDIVVKNGSTARVINLELFHQGKNVYNIRGDGVIIATPTGSTAYSLAAGGPVVEPDLKLMVITPLNAHSLTARPLVVGDVLIEIKCPDTEDEVILTADGQISLALNPPSEVRIRLSENKLKMVKWDKTFFEVFTQKMNWK